MYVWKRWSVMVKVVEEWNMAQSWGVLVVLHIITIIVCNVCAFVFSGM